jgi:predicted SprT family Zn-dependent metalloprotease
MRPWSESRRARAARQRVHPWNGGASQWAPVPHLQHRSAIRWHIAPNRACHARPPQQNSPRSEPSVETRQRSRGAECHASLGLVLLPNPCAVWNQTRLDAGLLCADELVMEEGVRSRDAVVREPRLEVQLGASQSRSPVLVAYRRRVPASPPSATVVKVLSRLAAIWRCAWLESVTVRFVAPRRASLASSNARLRTIRLDERLRRRTRFLSEVLCHEAAHLVAFAKSGGKNQPHGPEWRALMKAAGCDPRVRLPAIGGGAPAPRTRLRPLQFEHVCPVCHARRFAARRMSAWRCSACLANGLDGTLDIRRVDAAESP